MSQQSIETNTTCAALPVVTQFTGFKHPDWPLVSRRQTFFANALRRARDAATRIRKMDQFAAHCMDRFKLECVSVPGHDRYYAYTFGMIEAPNDVGEMYKAGNFLVVDFIYRQPGDCGVYLIREGDTIRLQRISVIPGLARRGMVSFVNGTPDCRDDVEVPRSSINVCGMVQYHVVADDETMRISRQRERVWMATYGTQERLLAA